LVRTNHNIITMQTPYMKAVLNEAVSGLQSDTVEGVIHDLEYGGGTVDLHITSALDPYLKRWVPVLISIIFGRAAPVYFSHWVSLFDSYEKVETWEDFANIFPGITMDWSVAMEQSFFDALLEHAHSHLGNMDIERSDLHAFTRKCQVHFKRIVTRILKNAKLVPPRQRDGFQADGVKIESR